MDTPEQVIGKIAEVAESVGWQAGVGAMETAGLIVSVLAKHPDRIPDFLARGIGAFIDGRFDAADGRLNWLASNGNIVSPEELIEELKRTGATARLERLSP